MFDDKKKFREEYNLELHTYGHENSAEFYFSLNKEDNSVEFREKIHDLNPDFILHFYPEYPLIPKDFHLIHVPKFAVVSDWNIGVNHLPFILPLFDGVFSDKRGVEIIKAMGYERVKHWQQYSHQPLRDRLRPEEKKCYDISFIGGMNHNLHRRRAGYLRRLILLGDKYKVGVFTKVYGEEYGQILSRSKIVFNLSIRGEMNMRSWEAPHNGALLFMEDDNNEIRDYMKPGREVILYNDTNFEELLEYYLIHDDEREQIAEAGREALLKHSFRRRFGQLMEYVNEFKNMGSYPGNNYSAPNLVYAIANNELSAKQTLMNRGIEGGEPKVCHQRRQILAIHKTCFEGGMEQPNISIALERLYFDHLKEFPDDMVSYLNVGHYLLGMKQWEKVIKIFSLGLQSMEIGINVREQVCGAIYPLKPNNEIGLWLLACMETYESGFDPGPITRFLRSRFFSYTGFCMAKLGIADKAVGYLNKAIKIQNNFYDTWVILGRVKLGLKDYSAAVNCYLRASDLHPIGLGPYLSAALCYRRLNMPEEEKRLYNLAKALRDGSELFAHEDYLFEHYSNLDDNHYL